MGVIVTELSNGLRVACDPMAGVESVALGVWVGAGGRHETAPENGIAHFLEHMAFKGTATRSARDIAETIEAVGGFFNAYTGRSQTAYHVRLLKDDVALGLDLLTDILRRPRFDTEEFERERTVILQELARANDTPDDLVFDLLQEAAYPEQAFGRPILGTLDSVRSFTTDHLRAFQDRHYRPDQLVISASGAVDPDRLHALAEAAFGDMAPGGTPAAPEPAKFRGGERRGTGDTEQVHLTLAFEGAPLGDPAYYASWAYGEILGGGMSSRLFQDIREERGLAYAVHAGARSYTDTGTLTVYTGTAPEALPEVAASVARNMRELAENVRPEELDRARAQIRSGVLMALESPGGRADAAATDLLQEGRIVPPTELVERVAAVDADAIRSFAARVLGSGRPAFAAVGDTTPLGHYEGLLDAFDRAKAA
ncbi:MAG: M16 family metallopeptidase [Alphaproteobacteria bacterium]